MTDPIVDEAALRRSVRTLLTVADNVRRGALPARALHRIVPQQVAADIVGQLPTSPGVSTVTGVHLAQPCPDRTYFTGSATSPDGAAIAYLGIAAKPSEQEPWHVTQVLPVTEQTLHIGPRPPHGLGATPQRTAQFREVITKGYLDPAVELLGPIPPYDTGQRYDWLEAATAMLDHGEQQVGPTRVVDDLAADRDQPSSTWQTARTMVQAYQVAYAIDLGRYATFEDRLDLFRDPDRGRATDTERGIDR